MIAWSLLWNELLSASVVNPFLTKIIEFQSLGEMPPDLEWFANLDSPPTRCAYHIDVKEFIVFVGVQRPGEMREVTRAHLVAWCKYLKRRGSAKSSIRRKLAALASLFDHSCEVIAAIHNPVR